MGELTGGGLFMYPDERTREFIDEIRRNGVTGSSEISRIIERDNGIEVPPHIIAEYKYREQRRRFLGTTE
jgi:methyl coenzyme M reductase alpha subunit